MDTAAVVEASQDPAGWGLDLARSVIAVVVWLREHWWLLVAISASLWAGGEVLVRHLAAKASQKRMALELYPAKHFEPSLEEIFRRGIQLARASGMQPWWAPRRSKVVRLAFRADGTSPFRTRVEGPAGAERLLTISAFGPDVRIEKAEPLLDEQREHVVRAECVVRGDPIATLREVPLEPDPLQPLIDGVADLRADLGDLAEICIDLQKAPKWALRTRRFQALATARQRERREAEQAARWARRDAAVIDDSIGHQMQRLFARGRTAQAGGRGLVMPSPHRLDRDEALGKLAESAQLVRVQILVKCSSNTQGRAQARMARVMAGLDVFGERAQLSPRGFTFGPLRVGADRWPFLTSFEQRWATGQCRAPRPNWLRLDELTGLFKPPTRHARLPVLEAELPTFDFDDPKLLLQGVYRGPDGRRRLVATRAEQTLFEVAVGKAGGGKTERALAQAISVAHGGGGLLFIDPHRDSWARASTFLAHEKLAQRIALIDLTVAGDEARVSSWNPIDMHRHPAGVQVADAVVDAFATMLGWQDVEAPRALTILTEAVSVLVAVNQAACQQDRAQDQATLFHIRPLLTDAGFRTACLTVAGSRLDADTHAWWTSTFPTLPLDAFNVILNPLGRLGRNPVTRAFLGQGVGTYNIRAAMDAGMVIWVCTPGNTPNDRLLLTMLARDLLRAGRSRRDTPEDQRRPFRLYFDELITLTGASPETFAEMVEEFRKFKLRVHGMTQLLARLPRPVQLSLLQNASSLSTTTGSRAAIAAITAEWGDSPSPERVVALDQFRHYASFTVDGRRIGPLLLEGPHLDDDLKRWARPAHRPALEHAALANAQAQPIDKAAATADSQLDRLRAFVTQAAGQIDLNKQTDRRTEGYA
ncbi:ATP/GTP-binding protein [Streptomyces sp. YC504]|uniref:ATP/GTP-binding protein n=1 Tax=Streptomyces mesophilus TaxID=1775132 RepID=A0A6G4XQP6_9ACTN|nr:ATP/GTP-binding protein [Streptomyces mesophilus]NGO79522.1 ATP/GTP-binding protein [Streptomyces mesophilus]